MGRVLNRYYDIHEALDPVGKEDDDVDNDGDVDDMMRRPWDQASPSHDRKN